MLIGRCPCSVAEGQYESIHRRTRKATDAIYVITLQVTLFDSVSWSAMFSPGGKLEIPIGDRLISKVHN